MDDCHEHKCIWMDTAYGAWLGAQGGEIGTAFIGEMDVWKYQSDLFWCTTNADAMQNVRAIISQGY